MQFSSVGAGALVDVCLGEGVLHGGDARHGVGVAAILGRAAVDDAGLVQVDMGLDQPGAGQLACGIVCRRVRRQVGCDRNDPAVRDTDIDRALRPDRRALRMTRSMLPLLRRQQRASRTRRL